MAFAESDEETYDLTLVRTLLPSLQYLTRKNISKKDGAHFRDEGRYCSLDLSNFFHKSSAASGSMVGDIRLMQLVFTNLFNID